MATQWFYQSMGAVMGPFSASQLRKEALDGNIGRDSLVRKGDEGNWVTADKIRGLLDNSASPPKTRTATETESGKVKQKETSGGVPLVIVPEDSAPLRLATQHSQTRWAIATIGCFVLMGIACAFVLVRELSKHPGSDRPALIENQTKAAKSETELLEERWPKVFLLHVDANTTREEVIKALGTPDLDVAGTVSYWWFNAIDDKNEPTRQAMFSASFHNNGRCLEYSKYQPFVIANSPVRVTLYEKKMYNLYGVELDMLHVTPHTMHTFSSHQPTERYWKEVESFQIRETTTVADIERVLGQATTSDHQTYLWGCFPIEAGKLWCMLAVTVKDGKVVACVKAKPASFGEEPTTFEIVEHRIYDGSKWRSSKDAR